MKTVFLAVCGPQMMHFNAAMSLRHIQLPPGAVVDGCGGWYVDFASNSLVQRFLAGPWSHIAWLDTDMIYPPDYLLRLMRHDHPIVSGVYRLRFPPYHWGVFDEAGKIIERDLPARPFFSTYSCKGAWICERRVFEKDMAPPWFIERAHKGCDSDFGERYPGKILVDPSVRIEHLTTVRVCDDGGLSSIPAQVIQPQ